jgi:uncharacterized membrane protein YfcA
VERRSTTITNGLLFLHYWFLLPVGIVIAVLVMSAGVSGATLWVPVYLLWLKLTAPVAFWLGLITMLFGFGSGAYRNWRDESYNGALVRAYLIATMPAALAGGWLAGLIGEKILVGLFGVFLLFYSATIGGHTLLGRVTAERRESISWTGAIVGGGLTGLISIGVGILAMPVVMRHRAARTPGVAIGSLVMIIFFTSLAAALGRLRPSLVSDLRSEWTQLVAVLIWAVPAVLIGGQIGPRIAQRLPSERHARLYFSAVLLIVAILTLLRAAR